MNKRFICTGFLVLALSSSLCAVTEYFVSTSGNDANPGTESQPFATLHRARNAVRQLNARKGVVREPVTVWIQGGTYYLSKPLNLSSEDSGTQTAPIVYRGQFGQEVRIVAGRPVKGFGPVTDPKILKRLDSSVRNKVVCADLKVSGISDYGQVTARGKRLELFFRDEPMRIARWPNEGYVKVVEVVGETPAVIRAYKGTVEGELTYSGDRPKRWADEQEIWLHGYWFWDWADSFEKVGSIDTDRRLISTVPPYSHYGYRKGQRYYALNVLAELDQPGEWYLDRSEGILYFLPPSPVSGGEVILSGLPHLFVLKDCSWVTIRGLILEATRSAAITISGGTETKIAGCTIRNTGSWAVHISGGNRNSVLGCDIYNTGEGGVSLSGGDRRTLTRAEHRAENNHIHHFGRIYKTNRPAVTVCGVGNYVSHNVIHDGPHNAIKLGGIGHIIGGNDHTIEFNEIYRVCCETDDVGAFYIGRDWSSRGSVVRHNYFHDISKGTSNCGSMAVYLDDLTSGISIVGNIFHRVDKAALIGGGRDNLVENNIFVDCNLSVSIDARGVGWAKHSVKEEDGVLPKYLRNMPYKQPPWSDRYPELVNILEDSPGLPKGNIVRRNVSFGGKWLYIRNEAKPLVKFEDNLVDVDPCFVNLQRQDFRLRPESKAFSLGFKQIPVEKIGLYLDEYRTKGIDRKK
jgi:Right handed beta helix region